jgi:transposase-like protein
VAEDYPRTLVELERRFSDDAACRQYLFALRWPAGFRCPRCQRENAWPISRGLWLCTGCRTQVSVLAGTVFQDTHLPLTVWFRAMWHMTSQKNGMSALGLQRVLGLGSYKTAWLMLHKLRQAMVRPGRERLRGVVEVDETYWGATESGGATGRLIDSKVLIVVAAEQDGKGIGRIRMARIPDFDRATLHGFIRSSVEPGSTVRTDGLNS